MIFQDRRDAGVRLATALESYLGIQNGLVLGLPRGGVPVAFEVARLLRLPLDVFVVRKVGVPDQPEYAMGAVASGGVAVANSDVIRELGIAQSEWRQAVDAKTLEVKSRELLFRAGRPPLEVAGKTIILVDDGLATGATMRAAVQAIKQQDVAELVVAVPVGSQQACDELSPLVDRLICLEAPTPFYAVGEWYANFNQTEDHEVQRLLAESDAFGTTKDD